MTAGGATPRERLLAVGGVVGPAAFVLAWSVAGVTRANYSFVEDAISRLAEAGASSAPLMTAGFVMFGVGVPLYAIALRAALPGPAWRFAAVSGLATLGVAALPLGGGVDVAHGVAATVGYGALCLTPISAATALRTLGRRGAARASLATGVVAGASLAMTLTGRADGVWQRLGLTVGDAWIIATALRILVRERAAFGPRLPRSAESSHTGDE